MSPFLKALLTTATAAVVSSVGGFVVNAAANPGGGFLVFLSHNPAIAGLYGTAVLLLTTFVHNAISKTSPPTTVVSTQASSPVEVQTGAVAK